MTRALAALALALAACGRVSGDPGQHEPAPQRAGDEQLYEADGTVLEDRTHGPELCLGGVLDSLPPQCGGVPIENWDWDAVDGEETVSGTTWGAYHVVGTYDDERFTVVRSGPPDDGGEPDDDITVGCPVPEGGWVAHDPSRTSESDLNEATAYARRETDHAGTWVQTTDGEGVRTVGEDTVLNVAFTGDVARHEAELRGLWGGPLCVVQRNTSLDELLRIQRELTSEDAGGLDLDVLWSAPNESEAILEVGVVIADEETREAVAERYGPGVVVLYPALRPVS